MAVVSHGGIVHGGQITLVTSLVTWLLDAADNHFVATGDVLFMANTGAVWPLPSKWSGNTDHILSCQIPAVLSIR